MGLDPQTHEPASPAHGPTSLPPASPSTRHMAQWESARLEAEARLSRESLLLWNHPSSSDSSSTSDVFLRLWNSEVGDSFRKCMVKQEQEEQDFFLCETSPVSQASTSTKCCENAHKLPTTTTTTATKVETETGNVTVNVNLNVNVNVRSDSCSSNEMEDSSESALQLLLDFPSSNDMSFLEDHATDEYEYSPFFTSLMTTN